jgi:outer membrane receptor protein involved in Fe transport
MNYGRRAGGPSLSLSATILAAVTAGAGFSGALQAQEEETEEGGGRSLEEITVTGTRIRNDDFNSPTPTTVVDSEYLQNLGIVNLGDAMIQMPQNTANISSTAGCGWAGPGCNFFNGSTLANLRGLNPFFGSRTLTLVDSRRHVPTNQGDGVDLNFIPTVIIERMEVVTGGASASYGSGAIGGVTNILLDRDMEGIKAEIDMGQTAEGDGDDTHMGLAFGTAIGENGHLVIGIEDQDSDNILGCSTARDWCANNYSTITNPFFPNNGQAQNVRQDNIVNAWDSVNGLFWIPNYNGRAVNVGAGPVPLEITADGTGLQNYDPGMWGDGFFAANAAGGTGVTNGQAIYDRTILRAGVDRTSLYFAFTYDISDRLNFFFDGSGGSVDSETPQGSLSAEFFCMPADYAYLPQNPAAQALFTNPANLNCFHSSGQLGIYTKKDWTTQLNTRNTTTTDLARYAFGFDGQFGESTWTWDAYYQYGESEREQAVWDNRHLNRYVYGFDAVLDASGNAVCRGVRDGWAPTTNPVLTNGCQPIDIFGLDGLTPEAYGYNFGFLRENTTVEQDMVEATASGEIADGFGAGPIQMAVGISFRNESIANIAAEELPDAIRTDFLIQYGDSFSGDVDVLEYFAEIDVPFHEKFNMNFAARKSDYEDTAGAGTGVEGQKFNYDIDTWKITGAWDVIEPFRIRFSQSTDVRAPNFRELYYRQFIGAGGIFGFCTHPWDAPGTTDPCNYDLRGGLELVPEEADTTTLGFVITPPGVNLRFAVDFYEIELSQAITPASTALTIDACDKGDQSFCDQITGTVQAFHDPVSMGPCLATCFAEIETVVAKAFNYRNYNFDGADFSADWIKPLAQGMFSLRFLATRTFHQEVQTSTTVATYTDIAGVTGAPTSFLSDWASAADLTANLTGTWRRDNFSLTGQVRHVSDGLNNRLQYGPDSPYYNITSAPPAGGNQSVNVNTVPSYEVYTLSGTYDFQLTQDNSLQLWGTINNLLDEEPPLVGGGTGGTAPQFFDTLGRNYRVGLRMNF